LILPWLRNCKQRSMKPFIMTPALHIYILENLNRNELTKEDWSRTISVSSVGLSPRVRKLSKEQIEQLLESGRDFTLQYLNHTGPGFNRQN
jgi:NTE family protein